jgi:hypothetical protein
MGGQSYRSAVLAFSADGGFEAVADPISNQLSVTSNQYPPTQPLELFD